MHPLIQQLLASRAGGGAAAQTSDYHAALAKILYRCDEPTLFDKSGKANEEFGKQQKRRKRNFDQVNKLLEKGTKLHPIGSSFTEHLRNKLHHGSIVSFPKSLDMFCTLSSKLAAQPQERRSRAAAAAAAAAADPLRIVDDGANDDDDECGQQIPDKFRRLQFVRVLHTAPRASWKGVPLGAVVGGRVEGHHIAVTVLTAVGATVDGPLLTNVSDLGSICLLDLLSKEDVLRMSADGEEDVDVLLWPTPSNRGCLKHCFGAVQQLGFGPAEKQTDSV